MRLNPFISRERARVLTVNTPRSISRDFRVTDATDATDAPADPTPRPADSTQRRRDSFT